MLTIIFILIFVIAFITFVIGVFNQNRFVALMFLFISASLFSSLLQPAKEGTEMYQIIADPNSTNQKGYISVYEVIPFTEPYFFTIILGFTAVNLVYILYLSLDPLFH